MLLLNTEPAKPEENSQTRPEAALPGRQSVTRSPRGDRRAAEVISAANR